ncbi:MAG: DUF4157 domain-containing protein [Nakamurella sp.]
MAEPVALQRKLGVPTQAEHDVSHVDHAVESAASSVPMPLATLTVGRADDPAEAAADRMADSALSRIRRFADTSGSGHGASGAGHAAPGTASAPSIGFAGGQLDSGSANAITNAGGGAPLSGPVKGRMESAFGRSFSSVRIHNEAPAHAAAQDMSARAFTHGTNIFFAKGQFDPTSETGEHVLAHELAHVAAGDSRGPAVAHRWPFSKKSPAEELAAQKAKEEKLAQQKKADEAKAEKKKKEAEEKAKQKQDKADAKAIVNQSKTAQKSEKTRQSGERTIGVAQRGATGTGVDAEISTNAQSGAGKTSAKSNDLNLRFATTLTMEKKLFDTLVGSGMDEEAARDQAYREIWMETGDKELRAVRPPRETAAERLVSGVKQMRGDANVRNAILADNQRGTMLSKGVELVYETFVVEVDRLMGPPDSLSLADAETQATQTVWDIQSNTAAKAKRPKQGSPVDAQAKRDARKRQQLNPNPPEKREALDKAIDSTDKIGGYAGYGEKATGITSSALKQAGKSETSSLQKGLTEPDGSTGGIEEKIPGGAGSLIKSINQAKFRVAHNQEADKPEKILPTSVETQASEGIGHSTGILMDLLSGVQAMMRFAQSVQAAHTDRSPANILKATKAGADALAVVARTGRDAAGLAKFINPGVTSSVASVIPGFNIFIAVMSIISNSMTMGTQAIRVHETDNALFAARSKGSSNSAPDVMVYPMLRVLQTYTKSLEQSVWSTAIAISSFATSVATVVTAGGYGIPAAVDAGVKVIDMLHSVGHFIAGEVLTAITKKAQKDSLQSLEGAAENSLHKDPTMAVDGIIFSAIKGDSTAGMFLQNYRLNDHPIDRDMLKKLNPDPANVGNEHLFLQIRSAVMAEMGEDENPQHFYQKWAAKAKGILSSVKEGTYDKWNSTGKMAEDRNQMGGAAPGAGDRGFGWRLKMMFKGGSKFNRSVRKTEVNLTAHNEDLTAQNNAKNEANDRAMGGFRNEAGQLVECVCGTAQLLVGSTEKQREVFSEAVEKMSDEELGKAAKDPRNATAWQDLFTKALSDRAMAQVGASA